MKIKAKTFGTLNYDFYFDRSVSISFDTYKRDNTADYKVLVQIEPYPLSKLPYTMPIKGRGFDLVCGWHKNIKYLKNGVHFPFGSSWLTKTDNFFKKKKLISLIASNKNKLKGHKLRHVIAQNSYFKEIDLFGKAYRPVNNKSEALQDYFFSVVIENVSAEHYFTEKLIDCLLCRTIPIYYGAPNIDHYFDARSILTISSADDMSLITNFINTDHYFKVYNSVLRNYYYALSYFDFYKRLYLTINKYIRLM